MEGGLSIFKDIHNYSCCILVPDKTVRGQKALGPKALRRRRSDGPTATVLKNHVTVFLTQPASFPSTWFAMDCEANQ